MSSDKKPYKAQDSVRIEDQNDTYIITLGHMILEKSSKLSTHNYSFSSCGTLYTQDSSDDSNNEILTLKGLSGNSSKTRYTYSMNLPRAVMRPIGILPIINSSTPALSLPCQSPGSC